MLALDDAALARLVIGTTRVRASERGRWLAESRPQARPATASAHAAGTMAARQRNGGAIYRLTGRLTEVEALHHVRVERRAHGRQRKRKRRLT
jgi:hypothetical protein